MSASARAKKRPQLREPRRTIKDQIAVSSSAMVGDSRYVRQYPSEVGFPPTRGHPNMCAEACAFGLRRPSIGAYMLHCGGHCKHPILRTRDFPVALAESVRHCVASDAASGGVRRAGHSPDSGTIHHRLMSACRAWAASNSGNRTVHCSIVVDTAM